MFITDAQRRFVDFNDAEARVPLVEDNSSVRRAMCRLLGLEGYHITPAASLSEALRHVEA